MLKVFEWQAALVALLRFRRPKNFLKYTSNRNATVILSLSCIEVALFCLAGSGSIQPRFSTYLPLFNNSTSEVERCDGKSVNADAVNTFLNILTPTIVAEQLTLIDAVSWVCYFFPLSFGSSCFTNKTLLNLFGCRVLTNLLKFNWLLGWRKFSSITVFITTPNAQFFSS